MIDQRDAYNDMNDPFDHGLFWLETPASGVRTSQKRCSEDIRSRLHNGLAQIIRMKRFR
jgi:hypothetical protein